MTNQPEKWLVIDTDAGVDDSVAICYAMKHCRDSGLDLKLIMTSHGNTQEPLVFTNVIKTLWACSNLSQRGGTAVKRGASAPLRGQSSQINASYFHGT